MTLINSIKPKIKPKLTARYGCRVTAHERLKPVSHFPAKNGKEEIYDFGQNFAGIIEIDPSKMTGSSIRIRHGEIMDQDGLLYTRNLRKAKAELIYHRGTDTAKYRPRFTYMGFRYAEITGTDYVPGLITAYALYSDMERTGDFACDNPLADRAAAREKKADYCLRYAAVGAVVGNEAFFHETCFSFSK